MPPRSDIVEIDAQKLLRMKMLHVNFILLDLRTSDEYARGHVHGAVNVPGEELLGRIAQMVPKKDMPIVVYDGDGVRAADLTAAAENLGYINVVNLEGGYAAWTAATGGRPQPAG